MLIKILNIILLLIIPFLMVGLIREYRETMIHLEEFAWN